MSHNHSSLRKLILLFSSLLLSLALAEGILRLRQWKKYGVLGRSVAGRFTTDAQTGLRIPTPGSATERVRIDSRGFRSPELTDPRPPGSVRLAFLGASTTFCAHATSNERTWPHLVWRALQDAHPAVPIDYVNAAVRGYTLPSSLLNLELRVKALSPDIIVIYHAQNDLAVDSRRLARQAGIYKGAGDDTDWLSKLSLTWYLLKKNVQITLREQKARQPGAQLLFEPRELSEDFRKNLLALARASQEITPYVVIPTFSYKIRREQAHSEQLKAASIAIYYMPYMNPEGLLDAYEEYNRVIRDVANETGSLLVDGELTIPPDDLHFADSYHFLDAGNVVMAHRVTTALMQSEAIQGLFLEQGQ